MIILPAIPAIVAALAPVVKATLVSVGIGAAVGGGIGAVGGAVGGYQEHGEINREVLDDAARGAFDGAKDGALFGGIFGPVAPAIAPIVAPAVAPVLQVVDDVARPVLQLADDAARPVIQAADDVVWPATLAVDDAAAVAGSAAIVDDATSPFFSRVRQRLSAATGGIGSGFRLARNKLNARFFTRLSTGSGNNGYVYVMDDVTTPGRYKIGKTIDPPTRIKAVQNDLSKTIGGKVDYTCIIPANNMSGLETSLHKKYAAQNLRNFPAGTEWFMLNSAQLAAACSR